MNQGDIGNSLEIVNFISNFKNNYSFGSVRLLNEDTSSTLVFKICSGKFCKKYFQNQFKMFNIVGCLVNGR